MTWDTTSPAGSDFIASGDDEIRELKTDLQVAFRGAAADGTEAKFPGTDTANPVFRYRGLKGTTAARPAAGEYGLYTNTTLNTIQRDNGVSWDDIATLIPSGTVMLFYQAAAPTGWTKSAAQNDKVLRVVSGGTGGTAGGSIATSTGLAHTHTVDSHTHSYGPDTTEGPSATTTVDSGVNSLVPTSAHTHEFSGTTGGATPNTDSKLGVLAYVDVILCTKD